MLVWCLTVTAVSMQTEPIIHLFLEAFALPVGPRHILSSNQQETGDPVRPECQSQAVPGRKVVFFRPSIIPLNTASSFLFFSPDAHLYFCFLFPAQLPRLLSLRTHDFVWPQRGRVSTTPPAVTAHSKWTPTGHRAGAVCPNFSF